MKYKNIFLIYCVIIFLIVIAFIGVNYFYIRNVSYSFNKETKLLVNSIDTYITSESKVKFLSSISNKNNKRYITQDKLIDIFVNCINDGNLDKKEIEKLEENCIYFMDENLNFNYADTNFMSTPIIGYDMQEKQWLIFCYGKYQSNNLIKFLNVLNFGGYSGYDTVGIKHEFDDKNCEFNVINSISIFVNSDITIKSSGYVIEDNIMFNKVINLYIDRLSPHGYVENVGYVPKQKIKYDSGILAFILILDDEFINCNVKLNGFYTKY